MSCHAKFLIVAFFGSVLFECFLNFSKLIGTSKFFQVRVVFSEIHCQEAQLDKKTSLQPQPKKIQIVKIGKLIQDGGCSSNFF